MGPIVHTVAADDARVQPEAKASRERAGSQSRQKEKQRLNGRDASVFGPSLGLGKAMDRQALDQTPPRDNLSGVPPAMYFGMMQREYANANVEMAQAPQPALPQHYVAPAISTATTWPRLCASA
ncbi:hypothetical protein PC111_g13421 [Phytophthora cactorum]|nr:hypothetical protein PC111_g13421 [Phytophthora cactorum]KAG2907510.1 hypothetical protein PC115_g13907 [Phytophthora cactorum]